jgi:hypothetical protein
MTEPLTHRQVNDILFPIVSVDSGPIGHATEFNVIYEDVMRLQIEMAKRYGTAR